MSQVTCHMSHVTCHLPPVTNVNSHRPSPANSTVDWLQIQKSPYHGQKHFIFFLQLLNQLCNFDVLLDLES